MKPRNRTLSGALIASLTLPVFLGLMACFPSFPVPVGDPEKSSIDPYISGIWMFVDDPLFYVFEPYDDRTWLLTAIEISEDVEFCPEKFEAGMPEPESADQPELTAYEEYMAEVAWYGTECYEIDHAPGAIKAWRTKLGGEWFMTWAPLGVFDAERKFEPDEWWVFRIEKPSPDQLSLRWTDEDHEAWSVFDDVEDEDMTRRAVERVIRKNADKEDFYDEDGAILFYRVLPQHYSLIEDFLDEGPMS